METAVDRAQETRTHQQSDTKEPHRLLRLVEQSVWANRQWVDFIYSLPDPEARPRELLAHVMLGESAWFARIDGTEGPRNTFPILTKEELVAGFDENARTYRRLVETRLPYVVSFTRMCG